MTPVQVSRSAVKGERMKVMQIEVKQGRSEQEPLELLVLLHCEGEKGLKDESAAVNKALDGHLQSLLEQREFEGKPNESLLVHTQGK
ncbi:MAG TPA: M17 family peptidase N-terminal domain-containing protein, partial [Nitrospiraceae bacterium]|nr:M17 family peptidase N-terminal domain-containing protein [Nitrospiraceae bacterium]